MKTASHLPEKRSKQYASTENQCWHLKAERRARIEKGKSTKVITMFMEIRDRTRLDWKQVGSSAFRWCGEEVCCCQVTFFVGIPRNEGDPCIRLDPLPLDGVVRRFALPRSRFSSVYYRMKENHVSGSPQYMSSQHRSPLCPQPTAATGILLIPDAQIIAHL
ncbi:hypothetical protein NDU88_006422 [Pleurodeles waltl]|uniref:Uncharacterized protein n=1 Tax=Pleurodeles waltl TaxID=8319 RepID=A0AAV7RRZ5_PLEWA|nr:hypothetical protein NDU88_006422 [Pleurodeles waltl]